MSDLNQLLLNFNQNQNFNYDDFYVSNSNYFAFKLIETWPKWEKNIVNIYGEKYSGKSHLAEIFRQKYKALKFTENQLNNKFFKLRAKDIMTSKPILINQNLLMSDALQIMNKNKITFLFAVNNSSKKSPVGVVHIHDCVRHAN